MTALVFSAVSALVLVAAPAAGLALIVRRSAPLARCSDLRTPAVPAPGADPGTGRTSTAVFSRAAHPAS